MAGISSKALKPNYTENDKKYNGIELNTALGLDIYEADLRYLDPQISRWWQVDPLTEKMEMWSPYASNYDNPIRYSDPRGDEGGECCRGGLDYVFKGFGDAIKGAAKLLDRFGFGAQSKVETELTSQGGGSSKTNLVVETEVKTSTNFSGVVGALENSSKPLSGSELPDLTKTTVTTTVSVEQKVEVNTPIGSVNAKAAVDQNGTVTVTEGFNVKPRPGVTVGGSASQSSNGDNKMTVTGSLGTGNTKATGSLSFTNNNQTGNSNVKFSLGGESKVGNVKVITIGFISYTIEEKK